MFATGVAIVTTLSPEGGPVGLTISSFNSVSLAPPLVLWSLSRQTGAMAVFERFATRGIDRWAGVNWQAGLGGVPCIEGAAALFECHSRSQYAEGDHTIFVAQVLRCSHRNPASPLLYHGGMFYTEHPLGRLSPQAVRPANK